VVKIVVISAAGGNAQELTSEQRNEADPSWSADGNLLSFGREVGFNSSEPPNIQVMNLKTNQDSALPGSDGLFAPPLVTGWALHHGAAGEFNRVDAF
jgi:Tol biopolymer transport system component